MASCCDDTKACQSTSSFTSTSTTSTPPSHPYAFPYTPYPVQLELMSQIYNTLLQSTEEQHRIGIFESPTGTGKSLSILCSTLHWLTQYHTQTLPTPTSTTTTSSSDTPSWVMEHMIQEQQRQHKQQQEQIRAMRETVASHQATHRMKRKHTKIDIKDIIDDDDEYVIDWYDKDAGEMEPTWKRYLTDEEKASTSTSTNKFLASSDIIQVHPQIIYTSRTHSQLIQVVGELSKTKYNMEIRCVSLGSRQHLCVHPDVRAVTKNNGTKMNDRCMEMQKEKHKTETKRSRNPLSGPCPYLDPSGQTLYTQYVLTTNRDLEELHTLGNKLDTCAYYGTRASVPGAHLIIVPYASLLHRATRESLGINLKNNIVVIDEAHNLIETINEIHSIRITLSQLNLVHSQLTQYLERFKLRLKPTNRQAITRILNIVHELRKVLLPEQKQNDEKKLNEPLRNVTNENTTTTATTSKSTSSSTSTIHHAASSELLPVTEFLFRAHIDHYNLFTLHRFIVESEIAKKLNGYVEKQNAVMGMVMQHDSSSEYDLPHHISPLSTIGDFIVALGNADRDGRVIIEKMASTNNQAHPKSSLRFLMLNPSIHFRSICSEARAIILAGGTMQPFHHFIDQLFDHIPTSHISTYACNHVVDPENVTCVIVPKGPDGKTIFNFTHQQRHDNTQIDQLGEVIINLTRLVPDGIVLFFPSYAYEKDVMMRWSTLVHGNKSVMERIQEKKKIFREPQSSGSIDNILTSYSDFIRWNAVRMEAATSTSTPSSKSTSALTGALLSCVVGGKMSEGINFSDELARCVVMIGMPYANPYDVELKQKMIYVDQRAKERGSVIDGVSAGQQYYENLCMRAVNQSIGRSIRHRNDYASIVLVDQRYSRQSVIDLLPGWIRERVIRATSYGQAQARIAQFFVHKKKQKMATSTTSAISVTAVSTTSTPATTTSNSSSTNTTTASSPSTPLTATATTVKSC